MRNFVHYREATGWARGVDDAIDSIEQLLNDGQAAAVIELCESALRSLLAAIQAVDDSDGHFGTLRDRLQDIHYRACQEAGPDPAELAKRLFHWELNSDFDNAHHGIAGADDGRCRTTRVGDEPQSCERVQLLENRRRLSQSSPVRQRAALGGKGIESVSGAH